MGYKPICLPKGYKQESQVILLTPVAALPKICFQNGYCPILLGLEVEVHSRDIGHEPIGRSLHGFFDLAFNIR